MKNPVTFDGLKESSGNNYLMGPLGQTTIYPAAGTVFKTTASDFASPF